MVSTKIPFKGTSKEYIGDDNGVLNETIRVAIEDCAKQLKRKIARQNLMKERMDRQLSLTKHIPDVCWSMHRLLKTMAGANVGAIDDTVYSSVILQQPDDERVKTHSSK